MHLGEGTHPGHRAINGALLQRRQHVAQAHRHRGSAKAAERLGLEFRSEGPQLLALEVGEMADGRFRYHVGRFGDEQSDAVESLVGAERKHQLEHGRIGGEPLPVRQRVDEPGRRRYLEALIDADPEFGRNYTHLYGAKLYPFDLSWNRAELARRINLALDAAAGIFFDRGGKIP